MADVTWVNAEREVRIWNLGLRGTDLTVMLALNTFAGSSQSCWPSMSTLAARSGIRVATARSAMGRLEVLGLVAIERRVKRPSIVTLRFPTTPETGPTATPETAPSAFATTPEIGSLHGTDLPETTPEIGSRISKRQKTSKNAQVSDEDFEAFWSAYPKKVSKKRAREKLTIALRNTDLAAIIDGARRYAALVKSDGREARFIKDPDGWLAAGKWDDETPAKVDPFAGMRMFGGPERIGLEDDVEDWMRR